MTALYEQSGTLLTAQNILSVLRPKSWNINLTPWAHDRGTRERLSTWDAFCRGERHFHSYKSQQWSRYSYGNNFHSTSLSSALCVPDPYCQTGLRLNCLTWAKNSALLWQAMPASYKQGPHLSLWSLVLPSAGLVWLEVPALIETVPLLPALNSWLAMVLLEDAYMGADNELWLSHVLYSHKMKQLQDAASWVLMGSWDEALPCKVSGTTQCPQWNGDILSPVFAMCDEDGKF